MAVIGRTEILHATYSVTSPSAAGLVGRKAWAFLPKNGRHTSGEMPGPPVVVGHCQPPRQPVGFPGGLH